MKKKMKKTLSLILAVVMLMSAVPMQSFALFDWFLPKVVKIEIADDVPISNKQVQSMQPYYGVDDVYVYGLGGSYRHSYKLHLSNGRSFEVDNYDLLGTDLLSGVLFTSVSMFVDRDECAKAIADGKSTVNVDLRATLYYVDDTIRTFNFEAEKEIIDEIVKDVSFIDTMPDSYDEYNPTASFIGKKFEVEYADGSKETLAIEDKGNNGYYLGAESISLWYGEDKYIDETTGETVYYKGLEFYYVDTTVVMEREYLPCPYSSLEILDYSLNGKGGITELTYKLAYKDGRILEKTCSFDKPITYEDYVVIDNVDGNDITVGVDAYGFGDSGYFVEVWVGCDIWEMESIAESENITDFCDCRCHKDSLLNLIVNTILCRIWKIFGINEYCQCGSWHW